FLADDGGGEPRRRAVGDERARAEGADGLALPPDRGDEIGECAVRGDDEPDEGQGSERDRRADLAERRRGGVGGFGPDVAAGDVVARVVPDEAQQAEQKDERADDLADGLATDEAEPELESHRRERERHENGSPPDDAEERGAPPLQHGALIRRERDRSEQRERNERDRADLVADARLDRRHGATPPGGLALSRPAQSRGSAAATRLRQAGFTRRGIAAPRSRRMSRSHV